MYVLHILGFCLFAVFWLLGFFLIFHTIHFNLFSSLQFLSDPNNLCTHHPSLPPNFSDCVPKRPEQAELYTRQNPNIEKGT